MATWYVDYVNGNNSNAGTSWGAAFATLAGATAAKGVVSTDTIKVAKTGDPVRVQTAGGTNVSATFSNQSATITLDNPATSNIHTCDAAWTADNGATVTTSSLRKEGTGALSVTTTTTPQLRAHAATANTDYSAYTGISFWIRSNSASVGTNLRIDLCSDTAGTVPVNSFTLPFFLSNTNQWYPIYIDYGGALSSSVQSVAVVTLSSIPTATVIIDNLIACTSKLNLSTLIGKDSAAVIGTTTDGWWPIRSINGATVMLEIGITNTATTAASGYSGTTETVAVYSRPFQMLSISTSGDSNPVSGTTISGGWNKSSGLQDGETIVGFNGGVTALTIGASQTWSRLSVYGGAIGVLITTTGSWSGIVTNSTTGISTGTTAYATVSLLHGNSCSSSMVSPGTFATLVTDCLRVYSGPSGYGGNQTTLVCNAATVVAYNGAFLSGGVLLGSGTIAAGDISIAMAFYHADFNGSVSLQNIGSIGIQLQGGASYIRDISSGICPTACIYVTKGSSLSCNTGSFSGTVAAFTGGNYGRFTVQKYNGTSGDTRIFDYAGTITSDTTTRHTASGVSWKMQPNSSATSDLPLTLNLQPVAVDNTSTSFKVYVNRSNTATLVAGVKYNGGDLIGANTDQSATGVAAANTWEQLSITVGAGSEATGGFTPVLYAYGDSSNPAYFDDASAT